MSVIKEIKTNFSAIAWCPLKEHASMMAAASMVNVSLVAEETEKKLALYDWNLENVDYSKYACEETLSTGVCSMSWGCTSYPEHQDAKGLLCLGLEDGTVQLWLPTLSEEKVWKLEMLTSISVSSSAVQATCFNCHNNWTQLCVGCKDGSVHLVDIFNIENPEVTTLTKPDMHTSEITHTAWNPKVSHIVCTATASGHVLVWDVNQKVIWCELYDNVPARISTVSWNPSDGLQLLTAIDSDASPQLKLWNLRTSISRPDAELPGHSKGVLDIAWNSEDPRFVLSTGRDNRVLLWDLHSHTVLGDLAQGEERAEIPTDAADFFTTSTRAASTTRKTQVCWNRFNPAVILTSASDGSIVLHDVQGVSARVGGKVQSVHYAAEGGLENRFHGKTLSVADLIEGNDLKREIEDFENSINSGDFKGFCDRMVGVCEDASESKLWHFMACMFDEDARGALFRYLGYDETPKTETPSETPKSNETPATLDETPNAITAEEMFASPSPHVDETPSETPSETPREESVSDPESANQIKRFIITGDFASAVDACFACGNSADALVIAAWGGESLLQSATSRYLASFCSPLLRSLSSVVVGNLTETVEKTTSAQWEETLAMILTYSRGDDLGSLCSQLGRSLGLQGCGLEALLCSVCAMDLPAMLGYGLGLHDDMRVRSHLSVMEAALILCAVTQPQNGFGADVSRLADKLGSLCMQLEAQGMHSIKARLVDWLAKCPGTQELMQKWGQDYPELVPIAKQAQTAPVTTERAAMSTMPTTERAHRSGPKGATPFIPAATQVSYQPAVNEKKAAAFAPVGGVTPIMPMSSGMGSNMSNNGMGNSTMGTVTPIMPMSNTMGTMGSTVTPIMPVSSTMNTMNTMSNVAAPVAEPVQEVEYEITAEQQGVMNTINDTIAMLMQAPLTTQQKAVVSKQEEAVKVMEKQFKKGLVSNEALALLMQLQEKLKAFDFAGAEEVYKKLNMEFWKAHKDWLLPLKHFLNLCKKMAS